MLEQAIELARSGNKVAARSLLEKITLSDPTDDQSWEWLAYCAQKMADKRSYLELALTANPENSKAQETLSSLQPSKAAIIGKRGCQVFIYLPFIGTLIVLIGALLFPEFAIYVGLVTILAFLILPIAWFFRKRFISDVNVEQEKSRINEAIGRKKAIYVHLDEWGKEICEAVYKGSIRLDMTDTMVWLAWGNPTFVDQKEITKRHSKERWIYGVPRKGARYVYFKNGVVVKIQE